MPIDHEQIAYTMEEVLPDFRKRIAEQPVIRNDHRGNMLVWKTDIQALVDFTQALIERQELVERHLELATRHLARVHRHSADKGVGCPVIADCEAVLAGGHPFAIEDDSFL